VTVTHVSGGTYRIDLAAKGDITIESGATVDVENCGYAEGKGPGGTLRRRADAVRAAQCGVSP